MTEEQVFLAVLDLDTPAARTAYLDEVCGGDARFRRLVDELLAAHFDPSEFLDEPVGLQLGAGAAIPHEFRGGVPVANEKKLDEETEPLQFLHPSTRPDALGRLGQYEVLQVLGKGGFGIVFRAFDDILQRVVALKVLAPALAATSPARKRFLREARSYAQVRHENVVQVYAVEEQPVPYLVMEFIPGETLQQRLDRTGPLEALELVRLGRQIAEGLAAAHATDLIHRDIKPANVLIEAVAQERVKITDFGLARTADDASLTQSGVLAGTPMYMAPEQAEGAALDHRADLFSLGSVLYTMATGRPPFRASTTYAVLKRVVEDDPRPIREVIPEIPHWLTDVIAKLHAKKPADRFQSARAVADVLAAYEAKCKANPTHTNFAPLPQCKPMVSRSGSWKWLVLACLLLPLLTLALKEATDVTHWLQNPRLPTNAQTNEDGDNRPLVRPEDSERPTEVTNSLGMKFKRIPAGTFTMGSSTEEIDYWLNLVEQEGHKLFLRSEAPEHKVQITQSFYLGTTEVTVGQFRQYSAANPNDQVDERWQNPGFAQTDEHPVVWIAWENAVAFCNWLSAQEGKQYRLPTEAEWEYSCRAGRSGTRYCYGDDDAQLDHYAWYTKNTRFGTRPVGQKKPNDWGLFDMHGNAWEWCQDYHSLNYYQISPTKDPQGLLRGRSHIKRGGAWCVGAVDARAAFRSHTGGGCECGFRVVLVVPSDGAQ